jgi:hypothetical protein
MFTPLKSVRPVQAVVPVQEREPARPYLPENEEGRVGAWPTGAVVASLAVLAPTAGAQTLVRARVLDQGDAGTAVVRAAEAVVDRDYARAGVTFAWQNCDPTLDPSTNDCVGPAGPSDVSIRIAEREPRTKNPGADVQGGCAIPLKVWAASGIVYVYSDRVRSVSHEGGVPPALVLGTIIAHEIGHLLLPGGHTPRGLMRALMTRREWVLAEQGRLGFTPVQSELLKASGRRSVAGAIAARAQPLAGPLADDFAGGGPVATAYSQGGQSGWD